MSLQALYTNLLEGTVSTSLANSDIVRLLQVLKDKQSTPTITRLITFYDPILFNTKYDTVHTVSEKLSINFATILTEEDFELLQLVTASLHRF